MQRHRQAAVAKKSSNFQKVLFFLPIFLSLFGLVFVFEASSIRSLNEYGNSFHYVMMQSIWITVGIGLMIFFSFFNYKRLYTLAVPLMVITIGMLVLVLIPHIGHTAGGAQSWISFGFFSLQPTEFTKAAMIIYLASWFMQKEKQRFISFMLFLGILIGLIMLQPDMGTSMIIFGLATIMYFLAGNELRYLLLFIPLSIVGIFGLIAIAPYRFDRLKAFLDPSANAQTIGYHINQIVISLSNGGLFGQGLGISRQKYMFLPEAHTDSIFAIIGEETGFIGALLLISALFLFIYLLYRVVASSNDRFAFLLAGGIFGFFGLQILINLATMVGLMPLTGVPLTFISYGGSHALTSFALVGIVLNIAKSNKELT